MIRKISCQYCGKAHLETEKCPVKLSNDKKRNKQKNEYYSEESKFLKSTAWRKLRKRIIDRDNGHCQRCLIKYNIIETENLEVHHIKPRINYPELKLEPTNCVTLCKTCNTQLGIQEQLDFKFEMPEEYGDYVL